MLNITGFAPEAIINENKPLPGVGALAITGLVPTIDPGTPSISISPSSIFEDEVSCPIESSLATGSASGGNPPYTYQWTWQTGGSGITILSPTSSSTRFRLGQAGLATGTAKLTVTDDTDQKASDTIEVSLECGT